MTNKREKPSQKRAGLDPETVVRAAVELLDAKGVDALSVRGVADRLDVRMNTVLWHTKSKPRLLELTADAIVGEASLDGLPEPWDERVQELARRYRRALLAHRDGASVVTGTFAAEPNTLGFAEALVGALLAGGIGERDAAWACWTINYFVLGLTQEEQAVPEAMGDRLDEAVSVEEYPALHRVVGHLDPVAFDERFDFGLSLIIESLRARAGQRP